MALVINSCQVFMSSSGTSGWHMILEYGGQKPVCLWHAECLNFHLILMAWKKSKPMAASRLILCLHSDTADLQGCKELLQSKVLSGVLSEMQRKNLI